MPGMITFWNIPDSFLILSRRWGKCSEYSVLRNDLRKFIQTGKNDAKLKKVPPKSFILVRMKMMATSFRRGISGTIKNP